VLSPLENRVILALQRDLEVTDRPFLKLAEELGVAEAEVLAAIQSLKDRGYIRRFGATLRHQQSGFGANALVSWAAPEAELKRLGQKLAGYRAVTHCYARAPAPGWPYNLYTMIHAPTPEEVVRLAAEMSAEVGLKRYEMLFSHVELKKTTMRYFDREEPGPAPGDR
jgi:DNA-binding Lrp family transcriptional regulator